MRSWCVEVALQRGEAARPAVGAAGSARSAIASAASKRRAARSPKRREPVGAACAARIGGRARPGDALLGHLSLRIKSGWARLSSWNRRTRRRLRRRSAGRRCTLPAASGSTGSVDRRRRPRRHKTALVLGGGGFTGGVYEIGALRALDLLAVNSSVNQFDVYVGTSAGAFIAALSANGVTPEEMMRVVTRQGKAPFKDIDLGDLLRPNLLEFARKGAVLPLARAVAGAPGDLPARRRVADGRAARASPRGCPRAPTPARGSRPTCTRCSQSPGAPTTSASWRASCT